MKHLATVIKGDRRNTSATHIKRSPRNKKRQQNETEELKTHNVRLTVRLQIVLSRKLATTPRPVKVHGGR